MSTIIRDNSRSTGGRIDRARLAACGVGDHALRLPQAERLIAASSPETLGEACREAASLFAPQSDLHADAAYRGHLIGALLARAVARAWGIPP
jgi:CO/xanthine dehydrogenase FAD-binding subunit